MKFTRRGFFGATVGAIAAAAMPAAWMPKPRIYFKGVPLVFDENMPVGGTYAGIDRASFSFWRNQGQPSPHNPEDVSARMFAMSAGRML